MVGMEWGKQECPRSRQFICIESKETLLLVSRNCIFKSRWLLQTFLAVVTVHKRGGLGLGGS